MRFSPFSSSLVLFHDKFQSAVNSNKSLGSGIEDNAIAAFSVFDRNDNGRKYSSVIFLIFKGQWLPLNGDKQ